MKNEPWIARGAHNWQTEEEHPTQYINGNNFVSIKRLALRHAGLKAANGQQPEENSL